MAIGALISRMDDRMDAVGTALTAALPARVVKRSLLQHFDAHGRGEIEQGVVMLVSAGEKDYRREPGMVAKEGTHGMVLVGHLKVDENDTPQAVEAAELDLIEEIKTFVRAGVTGMTLFLDRVEHSRQLDFPYGWIVAYLSAGPSNSNVY